MYPGFHLIYTSQSTHLAHFKAREIHYYAYAYLSECYAKLILRLLQINTFVGL